MCESPKRPFRLCRWTSLPLLTLLVLALSLLLEQPSAAHAQQEAALDTAAAFDDVLDAAAHLRASLTDSTSGLTSATGTAYRSLLSRLDGEPLSPDQRSALAPPMARLALLLPERLKREVLAAGRWDGNPDQWRFADDAGAKLLAWWRRQDPLPATPTIERLREHLRRVSYALHAYGYDRDVTGFDDRGKVYVKYGAPQTERVVERQEPSRLPWRTGSLSSITIPNLRKAFFNVHGLSLVSFPPANEVWFYDQVDEDAYYLFVVSGEPGDPYRIGEVKDLLPPPLQTASFGKFRRENNGFSRMTPRWNRNTREAFAALQARRSIYQQLAREHSDFATRLSDMLHVAGKSLNKATPNTYASQRARQDSHQDWRARRQREKVMPTERTALLDGMERLDVAYRTARFLEPDGDTRVEVYWAPRPGALAIDQKMQATLTRLGYPPPRRYTLAGYARLYDRTYHSDTARATRRVLDPDEVAPNRTTPAQTFAVSGRSGLFHLSMQFEQRLLRDDAAPEAAGSRVRLTTARVDSMTALPPAAGGLAMSDLRPMLLPRRLAAQLPTGKSLEAKTRRLVYPFEKLLPSAPLALYFEAYHLAYGAEDRTRYTVEYEIFRRTDAGGLRGLFGGEDEQRTATKATYVGATRTAREIILLDLSEAEVEPGSELVVTVRVTDEVTGTTQKRTVAFEVVSPEIAARSDG